MQIAALIRRHTAALWRYRWQGLAVSWMICAIGWTGVHLLPNQYQVGARIYADADAVLGLLLRGIALDNSPAGQVEMLQRTLLSRPNLETVVARTSLRQAVENGASRDLLVAQLSRDLRLTPQTRNLFTLEYRAGDPKLAFDVVEVMLDLFVEAAAGTDRQQMDNARQFLVQQISAYELRLREAERRRAEFQARYIDLLPSEANGGVSRLEAARSRLQQIRGDLQDWQTRRELTRRQLEAVPAQLVGEGEGGGRLAEAEAALRELRMRFTEQHPDVIAARNTAAELRANGGRAARGAPVRSSPRANPLYEQLRIRMVDADAQVAALERQLRDGQAEVERLDTIARGEPELQAQFMNLDRDYTVLRRNYEELLARRESIHIADAARTGSDRVKMEVVDPPAMPNRPSGPNRPLLDSAVLAAGLGAGSVLAFLLSRLDTVFYTVHDLRKLGLPVLGAISGAQRRVARRLAAGLGFATVCALLLLAYAAVLAGPALLRGGVA